MTIELQSHKRPPTIVATSIPSSNRMVRVVACGCVFVGALMLLLLGGVTVGVEGAKKSEQEDPCKHPNKLSKKKRNICNGIKLLHAASKGDVSVVQHLMTVDDVSYLLAYSEKEGWRKGFTALMLAADKNCTEIVKILVMKDSNLNHTSSAKYTVVYLLARNGASDTLRLVLDRHAAPDVKTTLGLTPLMKGAWNGYPRVVSLLLEHGANPNVVTPNARYSPLYVSSKAGIRESVEALLAAGADVNVVTSWGVTPLMAAAVWGREEVVSLLLQNGADPNIAEKDGFTALHKAVYYRYPGILQDLLRNGAQVDVRDSVFGRTPLHYSVITTEDEEAKKDEGVKRVQILRALLEKCPDSTITDNSGKTAMDWAVMSKSTELVNILQGYNPATCN